MDKYREQSFLPQHLEIHWFSIINSSVLVLLLLVILVTIFTRVLKHDFAKFSRDEELGDEAEETGSISRHTTTVSYLRAVSHLNEASFLQAGSTYTEMYSACPNASIYCVPLSGLDFRSWC